MKTILFYKQRLGALLATGALFFVFLAACNKDDNNNTSQMYTTSGNASGSQQNPPVTTTGTATLVGNFDATTNVWQYSVSWTSLSSAATLIEIHGPADVGVNGNLLFSLSITGGGVNGAASSTVTLSAQQEVDLLAGRLYYTIINAAHITGEVRGQIFATAQ